MKEISPLDLIEQIIAKIHLVQEVANDVLLEYVPSDILVKMRYVHGNDIIPENLSLSLALSPILKTAEVTLLLCPIFLSLTSLRRTLQNILVHD